ncbi:phage tail tube protein (plasmid) [Rouxiella badensis]|uniref:Phage tail protein n=1 Tax=Rouxiella badensis TaxID=1646377 RepID=A0A1X0WB15_9GAMM|nr:phage tail tube protein [Rouxiella badensis]ORJ23959.1 phage tail protein [Rouxiella badensis]WAT03208.1 phage tail tube protein [Rouxiella badensis]WAT03271.1 phage tail tube protein [Rouxiella badensis]
MGDTSNRIAGTASVSVDGVTIMIVGQFKYRPGTVKRETLTGMDGVHGFKEKPNPCMISAQVRDSGGTTVADFNSMTNVTVTAELANGKTIIGSGMWTTDVQEVDSEDAVFDVTFEGGSVTES